MKKYGFLFGLLAIGSSTWAESSYLVSTFSQHVPISEQIVNSLQKHIGMNRREEMNYEWYYERPLFSAFPDFINNVPCLKLGSLPTPIYRLKNLEKKLSSRAQIYLKDDGLTGEIKEGIRAFGGNKVRKLEFLLADVIAHNARSVMTYGCIGSNHVVATASLSKRLGLDCIAQLAPQEVTDVVKRNLLLMGEHDCHMILNPNKEVRSMQTICSSVQHNYEHGDIPYFIPTGGSCPIGVVGFVNAAFELKDQIQQGKIPEPTLIYVATGSGGTLAGLIVGLRAAGLKSVAIGVAVEPEMEPGAFADMVCTLADKTNKYLRDKNSNFTPYAWKRSEIKMLLNSAGPDYGVVTSEALEAIKIFKETENIKLDTTYTGKAAAGMLSDIKRWNSSEQVVLFWNTFCSQVSEPLATLKSLRKPFHQFFE